MANDRSVRSLTALAGASSGRVLNLTAIGLVQAENAAHAARPMFASRVLNNAIILKHRLRADEMDMFLARRALATKVIVPFERTDLRAGGRSLFVDQRGFEELLNEVGNYADEGDLKRDMAVLRLMDHIPSLDPFLLREQMRGNGMDPDASYFEISPADQQRMHNYAAGEIGRLTALANGRAAVTGDNSTARMVSALLSTQVNEKLEPLRLTLNLQPAEFSEGVFSWRGFLYYKWSLMEFWPNLVKALRELKAILPAGKIDHEQKVFLTSAKMDILRGAKSHSDEVRRIIGIYDDAYASLIERQDARRFREFLLNAPTLFLEIGEKMGAMSHVTSFWQYRFPKGSPKSADADELISMFEDFVRSFGTKEQ
jgi:hypothetical protein